MKIHYYTQDRTVEIADLFWQSVKKPFLAMIDNQVVGFIELDSDGYIDCMYTHPNYQEQGIASALYNKVLEIARENKFSRLYVDASLIAMPFFEKNGFRVIKKTKLNDKT